MINKMKIWKSLKDNVDIDERMQLVKSQPVPKHIAIIMDGNGRWARKRALPRVAGHHEGMKKVKLIATVASRLGVKALTMYAFSTENWKRPKLEVDFLMKLPGQFLSSFLPDLHAENIQVRMMGFPSNLPKDTVKVIEEAVEQTKNNTGLVLNIAINYGSRDEIISAAKEIAENVRDGKISSDDINEDLFNQHLMTHNYSDPELLIRTSGEQRLSNFMLWQLAYTEFVFTDVLWPDFDEKALLESIEIYQQRSRRFGGLQSEEETE